MRTTTVLVGTTLLTLGLAAGAGAQRPTPRAEPRVQPRAERVTIARGWLGILFREATGDAETMVVGNVMRDSPAAKAGIQVGDTVTLWNGRRDVATAMRERALEPGDTVRVHVRRGAQRTRDVAIVAGSRPQTVVFSGQSPEGEDLYIIRPGEIERQVRVFSDSLMVRADSLHQKLQLMMRDSLGAKLRKFEFEELPELQARIRAMEFPDFGRDGFVFELGTRSVAGAEFAEMNAGLAPHFGTDEGVLVLKVAAETPAARAGLQAGDVVVRVNDQPVTEIDELRRAVARAQTRAPRTVTLQVIRRGQQKDLQMRWE